MGVKADTFTATNTQTGQKREVKISLTTLKRALFDSVDKCTGPCKCAVEPDGECSKGWPSRMLVAGII